jgi:hypothetical protein
VWEVTVMGTYEEMRSGRRLVRAGAWLGVATAVGLLGLFAANGEQTLGGVLAILAWTTVLAIPSVWALLSLDRRPSLLPPAIWGALVVAAVQMFGLVPPIHLVVALLFWLGHRRRPFSSAPVAAWKRLLLAAALLAPSLVMGSHLDPVCTTVAVDGTETTNTDPGAPSGWRLGFGGSSVSNSTVGPDEVETRCTSDTTVWWEGAAGLLVAVAVAVPGLRWPINAAERRSDTLGV